MTLPADDPQLGMPAVAAAIPAAIAAGIRYAVNHGATVIDLPIDPSQPDSNGIGGAPAAAGGSTAEQQAVAYALAHNVVLVAPAGDDALSTDALNYPAAYPGVIAVGAFDSAFDKAPWTSHRSYVTLTAAGAGVVAASAGGGYQTMNSTSAASAIVAGIVALIRSRYPGLSVADIRTALTTTTMYRHPGGLADGSGYGAVDAVRAFSAAAALGTPASGHAGAGAQPLVTPAPAAAGKGAEGLSAQIARAGEISAGVLVVLLLAVAGYALIGRRRRPTALPATLAAQWTGGHAQTRYPHAPVTEADRMLEYFAPPDHTSNPASSELPARAGSGSARPSDESLFTVGPAGGELDRLGSYGPASKAVTKRALVSGVPPWEPAAPPHGELPWADAPARQTVPGQVVASGYAPPGTLENPPAGSAPAPSNPAGPAPEPVAASTPPAEVTSPASQHGDGRKTRWYEPPTLTDVPASGHRTGRHDRSGMKARPSRGEPSTRSPGPVPEHHPIEAPLAPLASGSAAGAPMLPDRSDSAPAATPSAQHRSGLPIRQPRAATSAPQSPSGSLWEPAESGGSLWEKPSGETRPDRDTQPDSGDGSRYAWDQAQ